MKTDKIVFKKLEKDHFPLLHRWLNEPHVIKYFQYKPISFEEVVKKYTPRMKQSFPTKMHIAYSRDQAFGYLQSYKVSSYPEFSREIGEEKGFSLDLYIGETSLLRQGLGHRMLSSYVSYIGKEFYSSEEYCYICHPKDNLVGIKNSRKAGFVEIRDVIEEGKPSVVLGKQRI